MAVIPHTVRVLLHVKKVMLAGGLLIRDNCHQHMIGVGFERVMVQFVRLPALKLIIGIVALKLRMGTPVSKRTAGVPVMGTGGVPRTDTKA
jgi:hypothetical protein